MADDENEDGDESGEDIEGLEGLEPKKLSGKKIIIIGSAALLLIIIGVVAFIMLSGGDEGEESLEELSPEEQALANQVVFYDLPEMLVNLNTGTRQASYLKVQVALEINNPLLVPQLDTLAPRVIDIFQVYLRELRVEDLDGSAGMFRLKEELLKRANAAVAPIEIRDILFREMLVQ